MPKTEGRLNIRIDNQLKEQAKETLDGMGLDMTTEVQAIKELNERDTETFNTIEDLWLDLNDED